MTEPPARKKLKQLSMADAFRCKEKQHGETSVVTVDIQCNQAALQNEDMESNILPDQAIENAAQSKLVEECNETVVEEMSHLKPDLVDIPSSWDYEQWLSWKKRNQWLFCSAGKLGCSICRDAGKLIDVTQGVHVVEIWCTGKIEGKTARKLKEKVYQHRDSAAHTMCEKILEQRSQAKLQNMLIDSQSKLFEETIRVFRTAYCVVKLNISFTTHGALLKLQEANGLKVGGVHRSSHSCTNIVNHIAEEMKKKLCTNLKQKNRKISIMLDEATLFRTAVIIIYLRVGLCDFQQHLERQEVGVENVFLGLVEATDGTTANGIVKSVSDELHKYQLADDWLKNVLIGICTDGAAVMTGDNNGVASQFVAKYGSQVERFHCMAHRLELGINDALKAITATNHFQAFVTSLFTLYSQSPKNQRELNEAAVNTGTELLKISGIFTVRWVASSYRTIRAVWRDFTALCAHFDKAAVDAGRSQAERAKFAGLKKKLASEAFVKDLALMKDVLREVSSLSLKLQKRTITLIQATAAVDTTIRVLSAMKEEGGKSMKKVSDCLQFETHSFKNVILINEIRGGKSGASGAIDAKQFMQAIIDNLSRRFPDDIRSLVKDLTVLEPSSWPHDETRIIFGEEAVLRLTKKLKLPARVTIEQFRTVKEGKEQEKEYYDLLVASHTYPCSSAECERGFSLMNCIATDRRNALLPNTISNAMFVNLNGPPVDDFDPLPFVKSWLADGKRLSTSWKPGASGEVEEIEPSRKRIYALVS